MRRILIGLTAVGLMVAGPAALAQTTDPYSGNQVPDSGVITIQPGGSQVGAGGLTNPIVVQQPVTQQPVTQQPVTQQPVTQATNVSQAVLPRTGIEVADVLVVALVLLALGGVAVWVPKRTKARS